MKRAALLAMVIAMAFVPAASASGKANTRLTFDSIVVTPSETIWAGDIFSPRTACKNQRKVLIFRVRDGADRKMGSTRSYKGTDQPGYYWVYGEEGLAPRGKYYAKVKPTDRCQRDRSETLRLSY
jgi:hypothetical protein